MKTPAVLTLSTLGIISTPLLSAVQVGWTRADTEDVTAVVNFTAPSSGTIESTGVNYFGFDTGPTGPDTPTNPNSFSMQSGTSVDVTYDFDHFFTDGTGTLNGALQISDYTIQIFGGTGTISAANITYGNNSNQSAGVLNTDFAFSGVGTDTLTLDNFGTAGGGFYGTLEVDGTWKGLVVSQKQNADSGTTNSFDPIARVYFTGITDAQPIPEPSSSALALLAGLTLLRRKR
ncbi:hypothetical protein N9Z02_01715 [Akkermansiaceae bacterium]|nr:hypothetical protein [Akkermansiaceae bacterium]